MRAIPTVRPRAHRVPQGSNGETLCHAWFTSTPSDSPRSRSVFQEDQLEAGMPQGALCRRSRRHADKPRSTGSHVVDDMPLVLVHEEHETSAISPDSETGTREAESHRPERRNDRVRVRVADGV